MRAKILSALCLGATILSVPAMAMPYVCPPPSQVNCVPANTTIGPWQHNGGQMTGNTFAPNNQCANVIRIGPITQRILCCYTKCGVFVRDVNARMCRKLSEREFQCD